MMAVLLSSLAWSISFAAEDDIAGLLGSHPPGACAQTWDEPPDHRGIVWIDRDPQGRIVRTRRVEGGRVLRESRTEWGADGRPTVREGYYDAAGGWQLESTATAVVDGIHTEYHRMQVSMKEQVTFERGRIVELRREFTGQKPTTLRWERDPAGRVVAMVVDGKRRPVEWSPDGRSATFVPAIAELAPIARVRWTFDHAGVAQGLEYVRYDGAIVTRLDWVADCASLSTPPKD